jgi:two-component system, OmpR family, sensor kinase
VSLRVRLVAVLIGLAALGLVALGATTYAAQKSFLMKRVDDQTKAALPAVDRSLDMVLGTDAGGGAFGGPGPGPGGSGGGAGDHGGGPGGLERRGVNLPPGTYGQRRDANGKILGSTTLTYGETAPPAPDLPASIPVGRRITVGSVGGSGDRYRVLAEPTGNLPGVTIVAIPLREVDQTLDRLLVVEGLVIAGVLATLAALAWWLVGVGLRPLERMGRTADAIATGELSRRVEVANERTEVGRLGIALNGMLAQIERAFAERQASEDRLRRFLADASHELRTPLVAIRGYAELFRTGAARRPEDTEKAMSRIENESARMGTLVEDLLALARLDQLPKVASHPVGLADLARDAADDARAAAPERTITVEADDETWVLGDQSHLRQVIGNLVRNALVHTPAGTQVDLRVAVEDGQGVLEVRDHGDGLPTDDADAMFERFWRADPGRGRGRGGAGLGLSIVAAIVDAHGGSVSAANAPDGGAVFTVRLPVSRRPVDDTDRTPAPVS